MQSQPMNKESCNIVLWMLPTATALISEICELWDQYYSKVAYELWVSVEYSNGL